MVTADGMYYLLLDEVQLMDCFEDSFLIESAQRYDIKGKAYIETPKKDYFSDIGLRNARINFHQIVITKEIVQPYYDDYGILTVNLYDFLLDPRILEK